MPTRPVEPLKVMVSDISDQYAEALQILLGPSGFSIRRVRSGSDAIWLAEHRAVDAAVLDTELPDMSGVRVLRVIRSFGLFMPIILVGPPGPVRSPADHEHLLRSALDLSAFSVLAQPVDLEVLLGQMARMLDHFMAALRQPSAGQPEQAVAAESQRREGAASSPASPRVEPTRAPEAGPAGPGGPGQPSGWVLRFRRRR